MAPGKLPEEFIRAAQSLRPGAFTTKPIHTRYGWHIIKLLETRPGTAPRLDDVKAQLISNLQQQRYRQFLDSNLKSTK